MTVVERKEAADGLLQLPGAAVCAAPELLLSQQREPALDLVKPGGAPVGVKCKWKRGWRKSQRLIMGVLWVP